MSNPHVEPLPDDIAALLEKEACAYTEDAAIHARVRRGIDLALALRGGGGSDGMGSDSGGHSGDGGGAGGSESGAAPPSATVSAALGAKKALLATTLAGFAVGGAVGALAVRVSTPANPAVASSVAATAATATSATYLSSPGGALSVAVPIIPVSALPPGAAVSSVSPAGSLPPSASEVRPRGDLRREREIIDAARAALAAGRPADALVLVEQHAANYARGQLTEERDALRVQVLVAADRRVEAERQADVFRHRYPNSPLLPIVEGAVRRGP